MDGENKGKPLWTNGWFGGFFPLFLETPMYSMYLCKYNTVDGEYLIRREQLLVDRIVAKDIQKWTKELEKEKLNSLCGGDIVWQSVFARVRCSELNA